MQLTQELLFGGQYRWASLHTFSCSASCKASSVCTIWLETTLCKPCAVLHFTCWQFEHGAGRLDSAAGSESATIIARGPRGGVGLFEAAPCAALVLIALKA